LKAFEVFYNNTFGNIKVVTIAHEVKNALEFIKAISKKRYLYQ